jgi:hypothetical protein
MYFHKFGRALALFSLLFVTACAQIPQAELSTYTSAFDSARAASEQVLVNFAKDRTGPAPAAKRFYPKTLRTVVAGGDENIVARLTALATVSAYNDALVALAQGEQDSTVGVHVKAFGGTLSTLLPLVGVSFPGLGQVMALATTLADSAQKAKVRADFRKAIDDGAKIVQKILQDLSDDAPKIYQSSKGQVDKVTKTAINAAAVAARDAVRLAASRSAPTANALSTAKSASAKQLKAVLTVMSLDNKEITVDGVKRPPYDLSAGTTSGATRYEAADQVIITGYVNKAATAATRFTGAVDKQNVLAATLRSYQDLLGKTSSALDSIRSQLDSGPKVGALAIEIAGLAATLKQQLAAYRTAAAAP